MLAGQLWGLSTGGREFPELRRRLYALFLPGAYPKAPGLGELIDRDPGVLLDQMQRFELERAERAGVDPIRAATRPGAGVAHLGAVGVAARTTDGAAPPQEVLAAVELNLDSAQAFSVVLQSALVAAFRLLAPTEIVLFGHGRSISAAIAFVARESHATTEPPPEPFNVTRVLEPLDEAVDHVRGPANGTLILEYGDYECPYSRGGVSRDRAR